MNSTQGRRKQIKDGLMSYGIDCQCPVDYELIYGDDNSFIMVLELDHHEQHEGFHYTLIAKKYLITSDDLFTCTTSELVSIEYLGGVLKWWD